QGFPSLKSERFGARGAARPTFQGLPSEHSDQTGSKSFLYLRGEWVECWSNGVMRWTTSPRASTLHHITPTLPHSTPRLARLVLPHGNAPRSSAYQAEALLLSYGRERGPQAPSAKLKVQDNLQGPRLKFQSALEASFGTWQLEFLLSFE